jgi:hypothetical protein
MAFGSDYTALTLGRLDAAAAPLSKSAEPARPPRGWIKAIGDALGVTAAPAARCSAPAQAALTDFERAEIEGSVTLKTLRQVAARSNCTLVYAMVPNALLGD